MDELRAYNSSLRDWLAQKLMGDARGGSTWGKIVEGALGSTGLGNTGMSVADFTPAGMVFSGDEAARAAANGHYGEAALNAIGAVPGGVVTAGVAKAGKMAKEGKFLESLGVNIYNPPKKTPRSFDLDYPKGALVDEAGKLTHDIDGRPLTANFIAGRRRSGGPDEAITPAELDALTAEITGNYPERVRASELRGGGGAVGSFEPTSGRVALSQRLTENQQEMVLGHELGHAIDYHAGVRDRHKDPYTIPAGHNTKNELKTIYNDLNNPDLAAARAVNPDVDPKSVRFGTGVTPQNAFRYTDRDAPLEYNAEAIRAYLTDPNYIKDVAPRTAKQIRQYVNSHPRLSKIIQFNSLAAGGAGAAALMPDDTQAAAPIFGAMGGMSRSSNGQKPFNFSIPNYLTAPAAQARPWNYLERQR